MKAVGIVDQDPGTPVPKTLQEKYQIMSGEYGIQIFQKIKDDSKIIIQIPNNLEEWIKIIAKRDQDLQSKMKSFFNRFV